jgi:hypothetical protein
VFKSAQRVSDSAQIVLDSAQKAFEKADNYCDDVSVHFLSLLRNENLTVLPIDDHTHTHTHTHTWWGPWRTRVAVALFIYLELEQNQELKANIRSRFENLNTSVCRTIDMKPTTIAPSEFAKKDWLTADSLMMHGRAQKFHVGQYCSVFFKVADMGRQPVSNDVPEYGRLLNDVSFCRRVQPVNSSCPDSIRSQCLEMLLKCTVSSESECSGDICTPEHRLLRFLFELDAHW